MSPAYTVWDPPAAVRHAMPVVVAMVAGAGIALLADRPLVAAVAVPVLALVALSRVRRAGRPLALTRHGVVLRGRPASWAHVDTLRIGHDGTVEVVMTADAPLPSWQRSRISDPSDFADRIRDSEVVPGVDPDRVATVLREIPAAHHVRLERS